MTDRFRRLLVAGAAAAALAPGAALANEAADVGEIVVTGQLEQTLPQSLAEYGSRLGVVDWDTVPKGLFVTAGTALS
ncbi:hypothetical protein [uncultured Phenylobacterium sp.]|uniref:hypothetical protein n=1 Tax=uncultured Phenylobacterium sp. TaxID=349273 RepID=UPI0025DCCDB5|nr:hypothetical protein [uncultured Phenylobacterium sp.]